MGQITTIKGIIIRARGVSARMYETVRVGQDGYGEIIDILGNGICSIQVFTSPDGLSVGEKVEELGRPITVEVGPHLLGHFFDGLEMSLEGRPFYTASIGNKLATKFDFKPSIKKGAVLSRGQEMAPPEASPSCFPRMSAARWRMSRTASSRLRSCVPCGRKSGIDVPRVAHPRAAPIQKKGLQ